MHTLIQLNKATPLSLLALGVVCIAFSPLVQAVVPAPDGGYPGGNTAEGQAALFTLTSGTFNTAVGFLSLRSTTEARFNTANGFSALSNNTTGFENTATRVQALESNTIGSNRFSDCASKCAALL